MSLILPLKPSVLFVPGIAPAAILRLFLVVCRTPLIVSLLLVSGCGGGNEEASRPDDKAGASVAQQESDKAATAHPKGTQDSFWLGDSREDIHRFLGVYGDPENPSRSFFVSEAKRPVYAEHSPEIPPGYLMMGAMWGDVAPWFFKAVSETCFEQQVQGDFGPPEPIVVTFETNEEGKVTALTFETVFDDRGRLERLRDLPEGW